MIKKAEVYEREYKARFDHLVAQRRKAKNAGYFYREPEAKLALVIRIRGINGLHPKPKKILQLLRLRQIHNAVFVKLNKASINMLKRVEPFVAYGYPSLKTVKHLIYKRGYFKINGQRKAIVDNSQISKRLKRKGILGVEDIIHEIFTVGQNFRKTNKFLWPFKLNSPRGGFVAKLRHFNEGGDAGNREHLINELAQRMI